MRPRAALHRLTTEMVHTHGRPSADSLQASLTAGFEDRKQLYVVLPAAMKTLTNVSNHGFLVANLLLRGFGRAGSTGLRSAASVA